MNYRKGVCSVSGLGWGYMIGLTVGLACTFVAVFFSVM